MNTLTIRLPEDLMDDLKKLSEEQSKPVSDIVRESIRRLVAESTLINTEARVPWA
jgi:predicted DNA-binding protein